MSRQDKTREHFADIARTHAYRSARYFGGGGCVGVGGGGGNGLVVGGWGGGGPVQYVTVIACTASQAIRSPRRIPAFQYGARARDSL